MARTRVRVSIPSKGRVYEGEVVHTFVKDAYPDCELVWRYYGPRIPPVNAFKKIKNDRWVVEYGYRKYLILPVNDRIIETKRGYGFKIEYLLQV